MLILKSLKSTPKTCANKIALVVFVFFTFFTPAFGHFYSQQPTFQPLQPDRVNVKIANEMKNTQRPLGYTTNNITILKTYQRSSPSYYTY